MCVMSMIMDHYGDKWQKLIQPVHPWVVPVTPVPYVVPVVVPQPAITPEEAEEFRRLLDRAREYDRKTGQPDCELESKRQRVRELAERLGVKVDFV